MGTGQCHTHKAFLTAALKSPKSKQIFKKNLERLVKNCSLFYALY